MPRRFTKRRFGAVCADNLLIAAGFGADRTQKLRALFEEWLEDRFPSVAERGYFLSLLVGEGEMQALNVYIKGRPMVEFALSEKLIARYGAYAPLSGAVLRYVDMQTVSTPLQRSLPAESADLASLGAGSEQPPAPSQHGIVIDECVVDRDRFNDLCEGEFAQGHMSIIYRLPSADAVEYVALAGGTGLLEAYPWWDSARDKTIRKRVHKRNLAVVRNCKSVYEGYTRTYVERVDALTEALALGASASRVEATLRALGPPESPYTFPRPAGASDDEYSELMEAGAASAFDAWRAIRETLDKIWKERSAGSFWIKGGLTIEPDATLEAAGKKFGVKGTINLNFEASSTGELTQAAETDLGVEFAGVNVEIDTEKGEIKKVSAKAGAELGKPGVQVGDGTAGLSGQLGTVSGGVKLDKDRMVAEVSAAVGPYKFKFHENGTMTVSAAFADVAGNTRTGEVTISGEYSFKDFLLEHVPNGPDGKTPGWAARIPDVKMNWEVGGKLGVNEADIMRIVENTPGFWEMRPREEFVKLAWASLDADEQSCLTKLGFDQRNWDLRVLPASTKDYWTALSPEQKSASIRLPIPTADPYWKKFWAVFGASGPGLADLTVLVSAADGSRSESVTVQVEAPGVQRRAATGKNGEAVFSLLPSGSYKVIASAERQNSSSAASKEIELTRGAKAEVELILAGTA